MVTKEKAIAYGCNDFKADLGRPIDRKTGSSYAHHGEVCLPCSVYERGQSPHRSALRVAYMIQNSGPRTLDPRLTNSDLRFYHSHIQDCDSCNLTLAFADSLKIPEEKFKIIGERGRKKWSDRNAKSKKHPAA